MAAKTPKLDHVVKLDDDYLSDTPDGMVLTTTHQHEAARFTAIGAFDMAEWARKVPRCDHERSDKVRAVRLKGPRVDGNRCTKCNGSGRYHYPNTGTWRVAAGLVSIVGHGFTWDVCNECWGSGDTTKPGRDLALEANIAATDGRRKRVQKRTPPLPGPGKRPAGMLKPPKPQVRKGA